MYTQALHQYLTEAKSQWLSTIPDARQQRETVAGERNISPTFSSAKREASVDALTELMLGNIPNRKWKYAACESFTPGSEKIDKVAFQDTVKFVIRGRPVCGSHAMDMIDDFAARSKTKLCRWNRWDGGLSGFLIGNTKGWNLSEEASFKLHPHARNQSTHFRLQQRRSRQQLEVLVNLCITWRYGRGGSLIPRRRNNGG